MSKKLSTAENTLAKELSKMVPMTFKIMSGDIRINDIDIRIIYSLSRLAANQLAEGSHVSVEGTIGNKPYVLLTLQGGTVLYAVGSNMLIEQRLTDSYQPLDIERDKQKIYDFLMEKK